MKINRKFLKVATGSALMLAVGSAYAFHDGGVAKCDGCHTMHNSNNGALFSANAAKDQRLLKGSDPSSTCMLCHKGATSTPTSYKIATDNGSALTPGGDFFWVKTGYSYPNGRGGTVVHDAQQSGHNIIAADFGFAADTVNTVAPGGAYAAADLTCVSCHDPHGKQNGGTPNGEDAIEMSGSYEGAVAIAGAQLGNYRILGDAGYRAINAAAPVAVTSATVKFGDTDTSHVAYGSGMSEWCGSCHGDFLDTAGATTGSHRHPAGNNVAAELTAEIIDNYNSYIASGDWQPGLATYSALVPFETGSTDLTTLDPESLAGPATGANVMCLSCHRAHASAWNNMTRWDASATMLVEELHPTLTDLPTMATANTPYYGRDMATQFGEFQRSLCNKCHGKD